MDGETLCFGEVDVPGDGQVAGIGGFGLDELPERRPPLEPPSAPHVDGRPRAGWGLRRSIRLEAGFGSVRQGGDDRIDV